MRERKSLIKKGDEFFKICSKCKKPKPISEFYKHSEHMDGLAYYCKKCNRENIKKWKKDNPEKQRKLAREYKRRNADEINKKRRARYKKNAEREREYRKKYRQENREKILTRRKKWREENHEKIRIQEREFYKKNRERMLENARRFQKNPKNIEKRKIRLKRESMDLADAYVKKAIRANLGYGIDISQEMIEAKRQGLIMFRLIREMKNESNHKDV